MNKIIEIFKQFKIELTWIYFFMLVTELSNLAIPFLLEHDVTLLKSTTDSKQ